jgi:hypothetical protein
MSTAAVSTSSIYQELQQYFQQRGSDLQQLGQALQNGDLTAAKQEYGAISNLGQNGPFAGGNAFKISQRQQDFNAIGQALQNGDLTGAQQAFAQLKSTFQNQRSVDPPTQNPVSAAVVVTLSSPAASGAASGASAAAGSTGAGGGSEIILNLGNVTPGEQITIGVSAGANGSEQVTVGVSNQQNQSQSPEQITLNLNQSSNQQIVLNLFNSTTAAPQGSGVSVSA